MSDYIKREDAQASILDSVKGMGEFDINDEWLNGYADGLKQAIDDLAYSPSAEVVEVVRCKDCVKVKESGGHANCNGWLTCRYTGKTVDEDDYCSKGERA